MSVRDRLKTYLFNKHISQSAFADNIGVSPGFVNAIRVSIQPDKLKIISEKYPDININWLLTGDGEMLNNASAYKVSSLSEHNLMYVPLVNASMQGKYIDNYNNDSFINELPQIVTIVNSEPHGKYRCFEVSGDSMNDGSRTSLWNKDIVLGREIKRELWKNKLDIERWMYVIITRSFGVIIKKIVDHDIEKGIITCESTNVMYPGQYLINLSDICELYNIIKITDRSLI